MKWYCKWKKPPQEEIINYVLENNHMKYKSKCININVLMVYTKIRKLHIFIHILGHQVSKDQHAFNSMELCKILLTQNYYPLWHIHFVDCFEFSVYKMSGYIFIYFIGIVK